MYLSAGERDQVKAADWLEVKAVCSKFGRVHTREVVSTALAEGDMVDAEDWNEHEEDWNEHGLAEMDGNRSGAAHHLADNMSVEIERRQELCGDSYPFNFEGGELIWKGDNWADPYLVCLMAADRDLWRSGSDTGKVFEHLTTQVIETFLGGCALRFGSPRDTMPTSIDEALPDLARATCSDLLEGWVKSADKDLGLDVVGWKPFPDTYNNRLQLYVQCATGEDWEDKPSDLNLDEWRGILRWGVTPVKALAIPYVVNRDGNWIGSLSGTLIFDRIRIAACLSGRILSDGSVPWAEWVRNKVEAVEA